MKHLLILIITACSIVQTTAVFAGSASERIQPRPFLSITQEFRGGETSSTVVVHDANKLVTTGMLTSEESARHMSLDLVAPFDDDGYCTVTMADAVDETGACGLNICKDCYNDFTHEWIGVQCAFLPTPGYGPEC